MPKQANKEKALAALLTSPSIREASKASGLSEETIYRVKNVAFYPLPTCTWFPPASTLPL